MSGSNQELPTTVSIVIPTLGRETVLLNTVNHLLKLPVPAVEILIMDQTPWHVQETEVALRALHEAGTIRWFRLPVPSIPAAMNRGLLEARYDVVLFLDDDIIPDTDLVRVHQAAHVNRNAVLVAGRVSQPWHSEVPDTLVAGAFSCNSGKPAWVDEFIGANFSVERTTALSLGGFDENFVRVAYRFEAEFAHRLRAAGVRIFYEPTACIRHLKAGSGGTRSYGEHLTTWRPNHAVGAYYCLLRTVPLYGFFRGAASRLIRSVTTRHHLRRPWWIPLTLIAELRGLLWAIVLNARGPRFVDLAVAAGP